MRDYDIIIYMHKFSDKKRFSIVARIKSSAHAWRGIGIFIKTTHNSWVAIFFSILATYMGYMLSISTTEWALLVFAMGIVFVSEAFNTAIEVDIDLTSPQFHPYARDTKDVSAGAVLLAIIMAGIIGMIIFLPKLIALI